MPESVLATLGRMFFAQFWTGDEDGADDHVKRMAIGVVAFLVPPTLFLLLSILPTYEVVVLVARTRHQPGRVADMLSWLAFILVTYSMVSVGFIAVYLWESLGFTRKDALVLGPLPIARNDVILAKLASLSVLLLGSAVAVNLLNALLFAATTAGHYGSASFLRHFAGALTAMTLAAVFIFAVVVSARAVVGLLGLDRMVAVTGSILQFFFVLAMLAFMIVLAQARTSRPAFLETSVTWNPAIWFAALFERLRGSPDEQWVPLANRGWLATVCAVASAVILSVASFVRQMTSALSPIGKTRAGGVAGLRRRFAGAIAGRNSLARSMTDFVLLTLSRNRAQQTPMAIHGAIGVAICAAALSRNTPTLAALAHPRTAVLWVPLVVAYWLSLGMRTCFLVPSELRAAWTFRAHAPRTATAYWLGIRAAMLATIVPAAMILALLTAVPSGGWVEAARHAAVVMSFTILIVEAVAVTVDAVPFTCAHPSEGSARSRWPVYFLGVYVLAYVPARLELSFSSSRDGVVWLCGGGLMSALLIEITARVRLRNRVLRIAESPDSDSWDDMSLNIGQVVRADA